MKKRYFYGEANLAKGIFRAIRWEVAKGWLYLHPGVEIIGITGSVGKTTAKEMIAAVLAERFEVVRTRGNRDPIFNLPLTALRIRGEEKFVAEMGVDKPGQMDSYLDLVKPRLGVLTRFSLAHADKEHFGSLEGLIAEKSKLISSLPPYGWALLNGDDSEVVKTAEDTQANVLFFGFGPNCDLRLTGFRQVISNEGANASFTLGYGFGERRFNLPLLGRHNSSIAAAAIAVGMIMGMDFDDIESGLAKMKPVEHRLEPKKREDGSWVIDDTYNSSPEAAKAAVDLLIELEGKSHVLVLGDMLELGDFSKSAHRQVGSYAAEKGIRRLIVIGDYAQETIDGYRNSGGDKENSFKVNSHQEVVDILERDSSKMLLIKGSRGMRMEKVVEAVI